jgi:hypothetical protein
MSKVVVESVFSSASFAPIDTIGTPSGVAVTNVGTAGATTYGYRISAVNSVGETLASSSTTTTTGNASLTTSNFNRVTWSRVMEASSYKIYGRTNGSELYMGTTTGLHFDDTGAVTPSGALPGSDTTKYDSTKVCIGTAMKYQSDGGVGPWPIQIARPSEGNVQVPIHFVTAVTWSNNIDWIFGADAALAAATRRIVMFEYNRSTNTLSERGFITLTYPPTTNHTIRGIAVGYDVYTKGSVAVTGTAVTGTGSTWTTDRLAVGSRIGFGSTDPSQITRWYEISAIGTDTSITLTASIDATISAGSAYCIEDLRIYTTTTNATTTNGGLFVTKGLKPEIFTYAGTTISAATTTDNTRAVMWLADASTVTNTTACGACLEAKASWTSQFLYVLDSTSNSKFYKYNVRTALTLASGKDTTSLNLQTGTSAVTGTIQQFNNGRLVTAAHGPGSGTASIYYATASRVYRAATSGITAASTTFNSDNMSEVPPGGTNTYAATSAIQGIDYIPGVDRFALYTTSSATRHYLTQYQTGGSNFDTIFCVDTKQIDHTLSNPDMAPPSLVQNTSTNITSFSNYNTTYYTKGGGTGLLSWLYTCNFGSDYAFTSISGNDQSIITPSMTCTGNVMFYRVYVNALRTVNSERYNHMAAEPYKIWYRTSGISDNSGGWTIVPDGGVLTGVTAASTIQFRIKFKTAGTHCLPTKVYSVCVVYENSVDIPSHLKWNFSDTNNSSGTVGFLQTCYYGSVPNLQIDYYRADTDANVLSQASTGSTNGVFEYWDGSSWTSGLGTDTINIRRRFRPTTFLPTGVNVYARLKVI